jgi:hypothetical protein
MTWWHEFRRRDKARDNYSNEETQNAPRGPPLPGPSRNNSSRRQPPPRLAPTVINEPLWVEPAKRRSDGHYNQLGKSLRGARPVVLQPPVGLASKMEQARGNRPTREATYVNSSNLTAGPSTEKVANKIRVHGAAGQQRADGEGASVRVRQTSGDSNLPRPPPPLPDASRPKKHHDPTDDESEVDGPSKEVYKRRGVISQPGEGYCGRN